MTAIAPGIWRRRARRASCRHLFLLSWFTFYGVSVLGAEQDITEIPAETQAADAHPPAARLASWIESLDEGVMHAQRKGQPVLARVGGDSCPWCKRLDAEIARPEVQKKLARWTLVYVDVDDSPHEARRLAVGPIPALRVLTSSGRAIAAHDGYLPADQLIEWLDDQYDAAAKEPDELLVAEGEPSTADCVRLVRSFADPDAMVREAASRRLLPYPGVAAPVVVKALGAGNLSTRLASLDLAHQWRAPIDGLDPWRPETFEPEKLTELERWAAESAGKSAPDDQSLTPEELANARAQIEQLLARPAADAQPIIERLARHGAALLPEVYKRLSQADTDLARECLTRLRYRLVASDELALGWSGGISRLASGDASERHQAADELVKRATEKDEALLLELFGDPDALVRETSLRGLKEVAGSNATSALVKLLDDPEPNVRAAVLKQLAEDPPAGLVARLAEYVAREKDSDLVVHAIRALGAAKTLTANQALLKLFSHETWQVRAAAAEAIGKSVARHYGSAEADESAAEVFAALIDLLDDTDAFVVSRAAIALGEARVDVLDAVEPLVQAAERHPEMAAKAIEVLIQGERMRPKAIPHLRTFAGHADPSVRAAAVRGLCQAVPDDVSRELAAAVNDQASVVRIAGAEGVFQLLDSRRPSEGRGGPSLNSAAYKEMAKESMVEEGEAQPPSLIRTFLESLGLGLSAPDKVAEMETAEETTEDDEEATEDDDALEDADEVENDEASEDADEASDADEEDEDAMEDAIDEEDDEAIEDALDEEDAEQQEEDESEDDQQEQGEPRPEELDPNWQSPLDRMLIEFRTGKGWPEWAAPLVEPLERMLAAEDAEEHLAAALALVPLGRQEQAAPRLAAVARAHPTLLSRAAAALPWLPYAERLALFQQFVANDPPNDAYEGLMYKWAEAQDRRAAGPLWELLARADVSPRVAHAILQGLTQCHYGSRYYDASSITKGQRRRVERDAAARLDKQLRWQSLVALELLSGADAGRAAEEADRLVQDSTAEPELRRDAFQLRLRLESQPKAARTAVDALASADPAIRRTALVYLCDGRTALQSLAGGKFSLSEGVTEMYVMQSSDSSGPIIPEAPKGLTSEQLMPLIKDADPETAAYAAYLLVLLEQPDHIDVLLDYWRDHRGKHSSWNRLVYRAIAFTELESLLSVLNEIHAMLEPHEFREFYWTIRPMEAPEVVKLRKQIRDTVGMDSLE